MLGALVAMYCVTESWVGTSLFLFTIHGRQGSPTSCLLFIIYVNDLIRVIKEGCGYNGFLQCLHVFVLIYDTVLVSFTRRGILSEISILRQYCSDYGMVINQSKTNFL